MAFGYGVDLWCTDELNTARFARRSMVVAQALYRRLTTPYGDLLDRDGNPLDYGFDLAGYIGRADTGSVELTIADVAAAQCRKDDRVRSCRGEARATRHPNGDVDIDLALTVVLDDEFGTTFRMTMTISEARAAFTGVTEL